MFKVYTIKNTKIKHTNSEIKLNTPKKLKLFTKLNSSPIKSEEKPTSFSNSFSFVTNNTSDSGKSITNFSQNEQTALISTPKNDFLSKKTKFHIDFIDKEKEKVKIITENNTITIKKKKKNKIISSNVEDEINEGRWDPEEHKRFIEAINKFGNEWKEVQKYVGTRSSNQVRSHAQKFFLKLKTFKDPLFGIDFTCNNIRNISDIINKVKEFEKENKYNNIMLILSQKLSDRNLKNDNFSINKTQNEDVLVNNNKIIINNESISKNIHSIENKEPFIKKEEKNNFKIYNIKEKGKKVVKSCKRKNIKKNKLIINENKNDNIILNERNEIEEKNKTKDEDNYYEYNDNNNQITIIGDYAYDNLSQFEIETNNNLLSCIYNIKEPNTITLVNKSYFC